VAGREDTPSRIADEVATLTRSANRAAPLRETDYLTELLDAGRAESDSSERSAQRWSGMIDEETATWVGTLVDLAEQGQPATLTTVTGGRHTLTITAIGSNVVVGERSDRSRVFLALAAVESAMLPTRRRRGAGGNRDVLSTATLQSFLFQEAGERPHVSALTYSGAVSSGMLVAVGQDVISIELTDAHSILAIPVDSIIEVIHYAH
jgi:hypothetical protein